METLNKNTLEFIIEQVSKFGASAIIEGSNESVEDKIINAYADGTVRGYQDAVTQILEFLEDLRDTL